MFSSYFNKYLNITFNFKIYLIYMNTTINCLPHSISFINCRKLHFCANSFCVNFLLHLPVMIFVLNHL